LTDVVAINYRLDVLRDLENKELFATIQQFAAELRRMRSHLATAEKAYYKYQHQSWFLEAVDVYCAAAVHLSDDLTALELRSHGFLTFREYLVRYIESDYFVALAAETWKLKTDLSAIEYSLHIEGKRIKVSRYNSEPDYGADVLMTFEKFKQGAPKQYRFRHYPTADMNHVEAAILDLVAQLYPNIFMRLEDYCRAHPQYLDDIVKAFDREVPVLPGLY
jgi:DNA mismatch repair protein MutS